jgi:hypothetical protein
MQWMLVIAFVILPYQPRYNRFFILKEKMLNVYLRGIYKIVIGLFIFKINRSKNVLSDTIFAST